MRKAFPITAAIFLLTAPAWAEPAFSKEFSPSTISHGSRATLTFTVDNSANAANLITLSFTDDLPGGLLIAEPSGLVQDCGIQSLTAEPGTGTISVPNVALSPALPAGATCTISLDIIGTSVGAFTNLTSNLTGFEDPPFASYDVAGASAPITVTATDLGLVKSFTDDPVPAGGVVNLRFTILNRDRSESVTGISFTDDLDATLSGLVATGLPASDVCGSGSSLSGTSLLTLNGGTLAAESSCTFDVTLQVPAGASPGAYPNTTSSISGALGGVPITGDPASDTLFVQPAPRLTKTFTDDPVIAGGTVTAEFTITNTSTTDPATDINFTDNLTAFATGTTVSALPAAGFCGAGSSATTFSPGFGQLALSVTGANLAAGASCTFQVSLDMAAGLSSGLYTNTTSSISGTVGGNVYTGDPATDTAEVVAAPRLTKSFDDPVDPGAMTTLEFAITQDVEAPADATGITFTDDLDATLSGLVATGLPLNDVCGSGSQISGTSLLTLTGGTLSPGQSCTFSVVVQVPGGAVPGSYTNTTSPIDATVSGLAVTGSPATDNLDINGLTLSKTFTDDPAVPGGTVNLRFIIANAHPTDTATDITFTDDLDATLAGLQATGLPQNDVCGIGSQISGPSVLTFTGGTLGPGLSCTINVTLQVPTGTLGEFINTTSTLSGTVGVTPITAPAATDRLVVGSPLTASKSFIDDPLLAGDPVTLRFTLNNSSPSADVTGVTFTDDLDAALAGLAATTLPAGGFCGAGSTVTGTTVLTVSDVTVPAGGSCVFDVTLAVPGASGSGNYINSTSQIDGFVAATPIQHAPVSDTLVVTQAPAISKSFLDDPVERGGTVTLELTVTNPDPGFPATDVSFTDDLGAVITGLVAVDVPRNDVCGVGSTLSGTSVLTLSGGTIPAASSCIFTVLLQVPAGAPVGTFTNTTSGVTGTIDGRTDTGPPASDDLVVVAAPALTKTFTDDPVEAGDTVTVEFTLSLDAGSPGDATSISFTDDLDAVIPGLVASGLPRSNVCGTGSTLSGTSTITLTDGVLSPAGSCTFSVTLQVPAAAPLGTFPNTTSPVSADVLGTAVTGAAASDDLLIAGGLSLIKTFTDDPAIAGGTVTLQFDIENPNADILSNIAFTDDLDAALAGLAATGLPVSDICGAGSQLSGSGVLSFSGGTLAGGATCTFSVVLQMPASLPFGVPVTNTTSAITSDVLGGSVSGAPASDSLLIDYLVLSKAFDAEGVIRGSVDLTFTIVNPDATSAVSDITFTDDLDAVIPGMTAADLPASDVCGAGSQLTGTSVITLTGGSIAAGSSCTFTVRLDVPETTPQGTYVNVTSGIDSGATPAGAPATAPLIVGPAAAGVADIPTLSEWMLILLAMMLGVVAVVKLR